MTQQAPLGGLSAWLLKRRQRRNLERLSAAGRPLVSVVVAARNAEATIVAALESLQAQSYDNLEILVVDDASEDGTARQVIALAAQDARIRLIGLSEQQGAALARNQGLAQAGGAYLTFQDSDDRSLPDRIERQLALLLTDRRTVATVCAYRRVDAQGRGLTINGALYQRGTISLLFKRDPVLTRLGGMAPLKRGEDSEYLARLTACFGTRARRLLFAPLYEARFSPESLLWADSEVSRSGDAVVYDVRETHPPERARYRDWHREIAEGTGDPFLPFAPDPAPDGEERDDPR
ncbi:MAG: hypothetical protein Kilf2KO_24610 [Rhodospirillales bacterium]